MPNCKAGDSELSTTLQPTGKSGPTLVHRLGWAILIFITLYICYFSHLGVIGFVGPDEPRYAWIARAMAETGDWVTPRLYGKPWFEKPPLLYWGGAMFFKLFGSGAPEVAARLPSAISALMATLALAWLAWRTYGEECARWLLLLLPSSVGMIGFSHAAATDMPFAATLTIAMVCAAVALGLVQSENTPILPRTPWLALLLFGFFLGLAVLAKGPAAIILCGGAVFLWALFTQRWRDAVRLLHPAAIAAFCVTALPWYILCSRRNPDFFRVFIIEHNFKRYLTPEFQHIQPFWYYAPIVILGFVPWIAFLVLTAMDLIASRPKPVWHQAIIAFLASWFLFPLIFFTISKSKLPGYILPVIPPLALLVSASSLPFLKNTKARWPGVLTGIILILLGRAVPIAFARLESAGLYELPLELKVAFIVAAAGGVGVVTLSIRRRPLASLQLTLVIFLAIMLSALSGSAGKAVDGRLTSRLAFRTYAKMGFLKNGELSPSEGPFTYRLPRSDQYSLNFYFHKELPVWSQNQDNDVVVFISERVVRDWYQIGLNCAVESTFPNLTLCQPNPSLDRPGGGRQPQQKE